jgi:hypothetical protein
MEGIPRIRFPSSNDPKGYERDTQDKVTFLERPERVREGIPRIMFPSSNDLKGLWKGDPG